MSIPQTDKKSHSYLLGVAEYERDKYKAALEHIASYEVSDSLNYYSARAMVERARTALGLPHKA
jgi:hypothetical protein